MAKLNCWEFKKCGREAGGSKVGELGLCPAATTRAVDGVHDGKNAMMPYRNRLTEDQIDAVVSYVESLAGR